MRKEARLKPMYKSEHFNLGIITFSKGINAIVEENKTFARAVTTQVWKRANKSCYAFIGKPHI